MAFVVKDTCIQKERAVTLLKLNLKEGGQLMHVYKVGGAVRDALLGLDVADVDHVVTGEDE